MADWRWPTGGGRLALADWRWPTGGGRLAVADRRWPTGGGRLAGVDWRWLTGSDLVSVSSDTSRTYGLRSLIFLTFFSFIFLSEVESGDSRLNVDLDSRLVCPSACKNVMKHNEDPTPDATHALVIKINFHTYGTAKSVKT